MKSPVAHRLGDLQIAAALVIQDQIVSQGVGAQRLQGDRRFSLGVLQVGQQPARCPQRQGQMVAAHAFEGPHPQPLQQTLAGFRQRKGRLRSQGVA